MNRIVILMMCLMSVGSWAQDKPLEEVPKIKKEEISILDPDTKKPVPVGDYEVLSVKEIGRRFTPKYNPKAEATFKNLVIYNEMGEKVELPLDRVTLVEYWSKEGNRTNKVWGKIRALEKKHAENPLFRVISINHDGSFNTPDKIYKIQKYLNKKKIEKPATLYFDLNDTFRDEYQVTGPAMYLLIDCRQQIVIGGRGDRDQIQEDLLDQIDNYITNMQKEGYTVNEKNK